MKNKCCHSYECFSYSATKTHYQTNEMEWKTEIATRHERATYRMEDEKHF